MTVTFQHIFLMLEFFLLSLFLTPLPVVCSGNAAGIFFSCLLIIATANFPTAAAFVKSLAHSGFMGAVLLAVFAAAFAAAVIFIVYLSRRMLTASRRLPPADKPCTVLILGCRVKGTRPTRMLRRRLNAALEFLESRPDCVCVVSGGKGSDEMISEAQAMKEYLIGKGFDPTRIYFEDKSTTTLENLKFSKAMIDGNSLPDSIAIATDGFHQYRASLLAKRLGINVFAISAHTEPRYALTYIVREWFALAACILRLR